MDKETKQMFELIINKLDGIDNRMSGLETRMDKMESHMSGLETRIDKVENRIGGLETRIGGMERRQDEIFQLLKGLEENAKVTRAEQDKMMHIVIDIQGKVTKLSSEVEEHETVIRQLRAIK